MRLFLEALFPSHTAFSDCEADTTILVHNRLAMHIDLSPLMQFLRAALKVNIELVQAGMTKLSCMDMALAQINRFSYTRRSNRVQAWNINLAVLLPGLVFGVCAVHALRRWG